MKSFMPKLCKLGFFLSLFFLMSLTLNTSLNATPCRKTALQVGLALQERFWTAVQNQEVDRYSKMLTPIFQGISDKGTYDKAYKILKLKASNLTHFEIRNPEAHYQDGVLIFKCVFIVPVESNLRSGPQLVIWKKVKNKWRMFSLSHSPLIS